MGLRRTSLVLLILLIALLQYNVPSVSSRPSSVDTNDEALPFTASKPEVVGFEGKARELAVVIKRAGGGGRGGRGGGGSGSGSRPHVRVVPIHTGVGGSGNSSGSRNLGGAMCAISWLSLLVLAGWFNKD